MVGEKQPAVMPNPAVKSLLSDIVATVASTSKEFISKMLGGRVIALSEIQLLNILLYAVACVLAVYLIVSVNASFKKLHALNFKVIPVSGQSLPTPKLTSRLKENVFYIEKIKQRNIFKMGSKSKVNVDEVISSKAAEAAKDLKLVGISWSDDPDVMVENTKLSKTYFVKKGQMIGDFKLEKILKDKIVLRYGEELIELR